MRKDLIPTMAEFNAMDSKEQIATLCAVHECSEKIRKIHREQYVNRRWNPHPPQRFIAWWAGDGPEHSYRNTGRAWDGVSAVVAFNCEAVREVYREAKSYGLTEDLGGDGERTHGGPVEAETTNRALSPGRHDPPLPIASTPF